MTERPYDSDLGPAKPAEHIYGGKKHLDETDFLAVIVVLLRLIAAIVSISPQLIVVWRFGLKRQVSHNRPP